MTNKDKALALAELGLHVFPCREKPHTYVNDDGKKVTLDIKSPYLSNGFLDASDNPEDIKRWWKEHPNALAGVACGKSGLVVLDVDVKKDDQGNVTVDGYDSLGDAWLDIPETFSYVSQNGEGGHYVYSAPEGKNLPPASKYRKMPGIDRRSGGSYVVWAGDVPTSRDEFSTTPEWFQDDAPVRSVAAFDGTTQEWFDALVPGEPNLLVRKAIEAVQDDFSHADMVSAQHHAIRLGAEGNPGVPQLIARLEEAWCSRPTENHTTPEDEWEYKFAEALASGIEKHGGAISLLTDLPAYRTDLVPAGVPERLYSGDPGDRTIFSELLRALLKEEDDDLVVLSVLWNAPTTRDLAREWGLEFCYKRIRDARKNPEPEGDNPLHSAQRIDTSATAFLSPEDKAVVRDHPTFIDQYLEAAEAKGFINKHYAIPAAWSLLSMAVGRNAHIPMSKPFGTNLWFLALGPSGTGKTSEDTLLNDCLDLLLKDGVSYYNLGANSSPESMHETLLERDGKASMIHHDEASDFFSNMRKKDWMSGTKDQLAKWYEGRVDPVNKIRMKENKGKSARTSFGIYMLATPDRLLGLVDTDMFETGFLARFNWTWAPPREGHDESKYLVSRTKTTEEGVSPEAYRLVFDLVMLGFATKPGTAMDWTDEAEDRLVLAHKKMDEIAKTREKYSATEPSVTRLKETMWKCAALLALWRGETIIREIDAMTAIYYVEDWFNTLFKVVDAAGEGEFNQDVNKMEAFIAGHEGVSQAKILYQFRSMIQKSPRELEDRLMFLVSSNRVVRKEGKFYINGTMKGASDA